ncbi:MAG: MFS transporter [Verrucomicrobia bacterium]|nr:MFS transporter [Verrucomicrobiota bacterium]
MLIPKKSRLITLLIISLFVYADIICENVIVIVNDQQSHFIATAFVFGFLVLQVFFASIQSALSDFLGRKKSLIISFSVSLFCLLCTYLYSDYYLRFGFFLILALACKAVWGNTIPISFAAIADTQGKNYRRSFALASSTYSIAFITLIAINLFSKSNFVYISISTIILLASLIACMFAFKDTSDKTAHLPHDVQLAYHSRNIFSKCWKVGIREIGLLAKELRRPLTKYGLSAYILWEISMYSIIISQIDLSNSSPQQITLAMMFGYLFGALILQGRPLSKISDRKMMNYGYVLSFLSFFPYFLLMNFIHSQSLLIGICYTLHALGNAFLSPTILSILATGRSTHDQGKILGLVESADTVAFLLATLFVMVYTTCQWSISFLVSFSFVSFSISWVYFPLIKKLERKINYTQ